MTNGTSKDICDIDGGCGNAANADSARKHNHPEDMSRQAQKPTQKCT
eukprot:CAMPEP_0183434706 /NCGR_PEP_ID=MMETSP0370-20130417/64440_1 /TAXON_ID=268820 /ORGANISM="Peridinium aciculiferum, Strain PAER-2" /LENGTH=46 /DNA_ID= /DNA_START= /DNA_END= /DNA_ORIENTATION=